MKKIIFFMLVILLTVSMGFISYASGVVGDELEQVAQPISDLLSSMVGMIVGMISVPFIIAAFVFLIIGLCKHKKVFFILSIVFFGVFVLASIFRSSIPSILNEIRLISN